MNRLYRPILLCLVFLANQRVVYLVVLPLLCMLLGNMTMDGPVFRIWAVMISGGLTLCCATFLRMLSWRSAWSPCRMSWGEMGGVTLFSLCCIFGLSVLSELLELPDYNEAEMREVLCCPLGIFSVVLFAPIVEELVFRESMVGDLLRRGVSPCWSVVVSALMFGLVHGNPSQIPFAVLMGIVFGCIYLQTHSIRLTLFLHIMNNGLAVLLFHTLGEEASLAGLFPSPLVAFLTALLISALGAIGLCRLMYGK